MESKHKNLIFVIFVTFIIIFLFLLSSYLTKIYIVQLKNLIEKYYLLGIIIYLFWGIIDAIGVPISNIPLIPIVVSVYGFYLGVFLTSLGWLIGSLFAFKIARKYGIDIVKRFISLKKIEAFQSYLPERDFFIAAIFSRIIAPHDFVNYGYGIFTKISKKIFLSASLIGIIISALIYSYVDTLPLIYQILDIVISIIFFCLVFYYYPKIKKRYSDKNLY